MVPLESYVCDTSEVNVPKKMHFLFAFVEFSFHKLLSTGLE